MGMAQTGKNTEVILTQFTAQPQDDHIHKMLQDLLKINATETTYFNEKTVS